MSYDVVYLPDSSYIILFFLAVVCLILRGLLARAELTTGVAWQLV